LPMSCTTVYSAGFHGIFVPNSVSRDGKVYMRFEWLAGWRVSFLDGDKVLPRSLVVALEEKLFKMAERGGGLKDLAARQALEHGIRLGKGGMYLELSVSQFRNLQTARPRLR
jgi:hypothetical protein